MKKLNINDGARYRWAVFARVFIAVVGGFLLASLTVPLLAYLFPACLAMATYTGMILSFLVWLLAILWAFSTKTTQRAWLGICGSIVSMGITVLLLKGWRQL